MEKRLRTIAEQVEEVLRNLPDTRSNDKLLVTQVYFEHYHVDVTRPFVQIMGRKDLPSFESIRRARQKVQADKPELRAVPYVENLRTGVLQQEYMEFAQRG